MLEMLVSRLPLGYHRKGVQRWLCTWCISAPWKGGCMKLKWCGQRYVLYFRWFGAAASIPFLPGRYIVHKGTLASRSGCTVLCCSRTESLSPSGRVLCAHSSLAAKLFTSPGDRHFSPYLCRSLPAFCCSCILASWWCKDMCNDMERTITKISLASKITVCSVSRYRSPRKPLNEDSPQQIRVEWAVGMSLELQSEQLTFPASMAITLKGGPVPPEAEKPLFLQYSWLPVWLPVSFRVSTQFSYFTSLLFLFLPCWCFGFCLGIGFLFPFPLQH